MDKTNEIADQQLKNATAEALPVFTELKGSIEEFRASVGETAVSLETVFRNRLAAVGVPYELDCMPDVGHLFGFVVGRLQAFGASLEQVHSFVEEMYDFRPEDDYEITIFGSGACHFIEGAHAPQIWRLARLLRTAIHEIYVSIRDAPPPDANVQSKNAQTLVEDNWHKAVAAAEVFTDIMYPIIEST